MATETNDKYPHKPSTKHTLEEVRKSLEDLVRNEFDDVEPIPQPVQAADADTTPNAPEGDKARRSLSTLPRRRPVGLDTTQLLRSLKGLISDELSEADSEPAHEQESGDDAAAVHGHAHASIGSTSEASAADDHALGGVGATVTEAAPTQHVPVPAPGATESLAAPSGKGETADESEEITLEAFTVTKGVPQPDAGNGGRGQSDLEALEKVTDTLGEGSPPPLIATEHGERDAARIAPEPTTLDAPDPALPPDPKTEPWSQLPLLKVVDLPETAGTQRAFAVHDPVFAGDPRHGALRGEGQVTDAAPVPEAPPMFISEWLDEDPARQVTDSELGLFAEETDAEIEPLSAPAPPTLDGALTVDLEEGAPGPGKGANADDDRTGIDEESAGAEPTPEASVDQPGWDEIDLLEIPGGDFVDRDTAQAEIALPAPDSDDHAAEAIELTLEAPEETAMPHKIPNTDENEQADIDLSAESVDEPGIAFDRPAEREHAGDELQPPTKEEQAEHTTPKPEAGRRETKKELRTTLGQTDNNFMKMAAVDFNADASPAEDESSTAGPGKSAPPSDPEPDTAVSAEQSAVESPAPGKKKDTPETPPSPPLSLAEESSPGVRSKAADKETVPSKRPGADSPQPAARTPRRPERPLAKSKSGKSELTLEPDARQQPAGQDAAQQTGPPSGVPEWYRRPFKFEQVAPVKPAEPRAKAPSHEARATPKSPARAAPDKIPVLDAVIADRERPKAKAAATVADRERLKAMPPAAVGDRERPKAKAAAAGPAKAAPPAAQKAGRRDSAAARSLAIQIVAKLNMELRKCGERALSPAIVDRLQYLLREALAQGGSDVDNSKNKKS
jgi:hypothetical protein